MILSMTGYGMARVVNPICTVTVEIKALNSKGLELVVKSNKMLMEEEVLLKNILSRELERGKITALVTIESGLVKKGPEIFNLEIAEGYYRQLKALREKLEIPPGDDLRALLTLPEVLSTELKGLQEGEWELLEQGALEACKKMVLSRQEEGKALKEDLINRCNALEDLLKLIEPLESKRLENIRARIHQNLKDIIGENQINNDRFEQELLFYAEKLDINEEKVRLASHLVFLRQVLDEKGNNGRKINFIGQEIGREVNTIGSKANDAEMQRIVVQMKEELEKIKEQSMNIL